MLGKLYYWWQLSLTGPLFKLIGGAGKKVGRGALASRCKMPKAFKVKVVDNTSFDLAWTPQLPDNPFHVEDYILGYCQLAEDGTQSEWVERPMTDPTEFHKKDKEKPKEVGKAERKRLVLGELPSNTSFRLRICASGPSGRSDWTAEVLATTMAEPDENGGLTGPLEPGAPLEVRTYRWWQSKHEVGLWLPIPAGWTSKDVKVKVTPQTFKMWQPDGRVILAGPLDKKVKTDEVDWVIEDTKDGKGKQILVTLRKEKLMELWEAFIDAEGHAKINTKLLKLFHEGNSMNELATRDLWE
jgi:hypothetical protein